MNSFPIGSAVTLHGLVGAAKYNGTNGIVASALDPATGRQTVAVAAANATVAAKPANLKPQDAAANNDGASEDFHAYYAHAAPSRTNTSAGSEQPGVNASVSNDDDASTDGSNEATSRKRPADSADERTGMERWLGMKASAKKKPKKQPKTSNGARVGTQGRTYLTVPYDEKDDAKALGANWDPQRKQWYVRPGKDLAPFVEWDPVPEGHCETCHDHLLKVAEAIDLGDDYVCGFCGRELCGRCLPYEEEKCHRCDGCGRYSCNAWGKGNPKCPQFLDETEPEMDISYCGNFGRRRGCAAE